MRTTLNIDDDVYEVALDRARATGESIGKVVSDLARRGFPSGDKVRMVKKGRFFQVDLPPGAPKIEPSRVRKIWEDEGII
jgi:hypothetical protein